MPKKERLKNIKGGIPSGLLQNKDLEIYGKMGRRRDKEFIYR